MKLSCERDQLRDLWLSTVDLNGSRNAVMDEQGNVLAQFVELHALADEFAKKNQCKIDSTPSSTNPKRRAVGLGKLIHPFEVVVARLGCLISGLVWTMEEEDIDLSSGTLDEEEDKDLLYIISTSGTSSFTKKVNGSAAGVVLMHGTRFLIIVLHLSHLWYSNFESNSLVPESILSLLR